MNRTATIVFLVILTQGCAFFSGPEKNLMGGGRVTSASPNQMFEKSFEQFNDYQLLWLLDPSSTIAGKAFDKQTQSQQAKEIRTAFKTANSYTAPEAHRSQIQDR